MKNFNVIGVMSGTSLDGVDIVYVKFIQNESWSFKIINSKTNHLIASHSYAHPNFKETNENIIIEDFKKAEYFFKTLDIKPNVLVFPRNQVAHLSILKKFNYKFVILCSLNKHWNNW